MKGICDIVVTVMGLQPLGKYGTEAKGGTVTLSHCTGALHSSNQADSCGVEPTEGWCQTKRGGPALPEGNPQFSLAGGQVQYESVRGNDASSMLPSVGASSARAILELGASCARARRELPEPSRMKTLSPFQNILGRPSRSTSTLFPMLFHALPCTSTALPLHFQCSSTVSTAFHSLFTRSSNTLSSFRLPPFPLPVPRFR